MQQKFILVHRPEEEPPPAEGLFLPAPLAYRVGRDLRLCRVRDFRPPREGLMAIACEAGTGAGPLASLSTQILRECALQNYRGVLLDLPKVPGPALSLLASSLAVSLGRRGLRLTLPLSPALPAGALPLLTSSPLSGSASAAALKRQCRRSGPFALDLRVRRRELRLPEPGPGRSLREGEAQKALAEAGAGAFYSEELMAMYGSLLRGEEAYMLLWDTAESLARRMEDGARAGAEAVYLIWEELEPLWPRLRERLLKT